MSYKCFVPSVDEWKSVVRRPDCTGGVSSSSPRVLCTGIYHPWFMVDTFDRPRCSHQCRGRGLQARLSSTPHPQIRYHSLFSNGPITYFWNQMIGPSGYYLFSNRSEHLLFICRKSVVLFFFFYFTVIVKDLGLTTVGEVVRTWMVRFEVVNIPNASLWEMLV